MRKATKQSDGRPAAGPKYCALYIRVSTADQGERYSPASQLRRLHEMAAADGYTVKPEDVFVDKHTGKIAARPDFERLRARVKSGAIQAVLVLSVDRFARRVEDAAAIFSEFKRHGVHLDFAEMRMEDSASSRFMFNAMCSMAEYMGEKLIADGKRGARQKLEQGLLTHGSAAYAYKYIDKRQKDGSRLEIDPSDSSVPGLSMVEVARDVYNIRKANTPTYRIVRSLNERGILSAGHWGKGGVWVPPGPWSRQTVLQMLKNPTYKGKHMRSGVEVPCPAIIDEETWNAVQRVNEQSRRQHTGRPSKNKYLLRGFLWCAKCTRRCIRSGTNGRHGAKARVYYRCGNIEYKPYKRRCAALGVEVGLIEKAAWDAIWGLLKNPALLLELGRAYYEAMGKPEGASTGTLQRELERLTAKIATTRDMIQDNLMPYAKGKVDIRASEERIRQIEQELAAAGRVVSLPPLHAAEAALREITSGSEPKTYERRRNILEGILDLRMNYYDGDLEITGKVPVPDAAASVGNGKKKCNTGLRADPQSQRRNDGNRKPRALPQRAERVANVARNVAQPFREALVAALVLGELESSEFEAREAFGLSAAHTAIHVVLDLLIEMEAEFGVHPPFPIAAADAEFHSFVSKTSEIASHSRFQPAVSDSSWRRPSRVRL
jgi:site-specific DNA recombinase